MSTSKKQFRNAMFTVNNYVPEDEDELQKFAEAKCKYLVYGKEIAPTTGTPHLQVACVFNNPIMFNTIQQMCPTHQANIQAIKALTGPNNAFDYCKKGLQTHEEFCESGIHGLKFGEEADFYEHGDQPQPGKRNDISSAREAALQHDSWFDIVNDPAPCVQQTLAHFPHYLRNVHNNRPPTKIEIELRPWQQVLVDLVTQPADDRTIHWVYDPKGSAGKSTIAKVLCANHGAILLSGKYADMFHAYDGQKIIVVDISRSTPDQYINYGAIEKLKDGHFFSGKYESRQYLRPYNAHVIVFSNQEPAPNQWTSDRCNLIQLSEPDLTDLSSQFPPEPQPYPIFNSNTWQ